jgi:hypothetical protein
VLIIKIIKDFISWKWNFSINKRRWNIFGFLNNSYNDDVNKRIQIIVMQYLLRLNLNCKIFNVVDRSFWIYLRYYKILLGKYKVVLIVWQQKSDIRNLERKNVQFQKFLRGTQEIFPINNAAEISCCLYIEANKLEHNIWLLVKNLMIKNHNDQLK